MTRELTATEILWRRCRNYHRPEDLAHLRQHVLDRAAILSIRPDPRRWWVRDGEEYPIFSRGRWWCVSAIRAEFRRLWPGAMLGRDAEEWLKALHPMMTAIPDWREAKRYPPVVTFHDQEWADAVFIGYARDAAREQAARRPWWRFWR